MRINWICSQHGLRHVSTISTQEPEGIPAACDHCGKWCAWEPVRGSTEEGGTDG